MRDKQPEIEQRGGHLAVIGRGTQEETRAFSADMPVTFPLLVDGTGAAYRQAELRRGRLWHLFRKSDRDNRARARAAGFSQKGIGTDPLQLGGTFVFGPGNADLLARPASSFGDALPFDEILQAVTA